MTRRRERRKRDRFILFHAVVHIYPWPIEDQQGVLPEEILEALTCDYKRKDAKSSLAHQIGKGILSTLQDQLVKVGGVQYANRDMLVLYEAAWNKENTMIYSCRHSVGGGATDPRVLNRVGSGYGRTSLASISGAMKMIVGNQGIQSTTSEQLLRAMSVCIREVGVTVTLPTASSFNRSEEKPTCDKVTKKVQDAQSGAYLTLVALKLVVSLRVLRCQYVLYNYKGMLVSSFSIGPVSATALPMTEFVLNRMRGKNTSVGCTPYPPPTLKQFMRHLRGGRSTITLHCVITRAPVRYKSDSQIGTPKDHTTWEDLWAYEDTMPSNTQTETPAPALSEKVLPIEEPSSEEWFEFLFYGSPSDPELMDRDVAKLSTLPHSPECEVFAAPENPDASTDRAVPDDEKLPDGNNEEDKKDLYYCMQGLASETNREGVGIEQYPARASFPYANFDEEDPFGSSEGLMPRSSSSQRLSCLDGSLYQGDEFDPLPAFHDSQSRRKGLLDELKASTLDDLNATSCLQMNDGDEKVPITDEEEMDAEDDLERVYRPLWSSENAPLRFNDEILPPLKIPDKLGRVHDDAGTCTKSQPEPDESEGDKKNFPTTTINAPNNGAMLPTSARMMSKSSYLSQQDKLYLGPQTPPELRLDTARGRLPQRQRCVLVVFGANDLRVHDNYNLALASMRAHAAGGIPVVAVCVLDYRTFAQPSLVGGFFRQSPQRAQFLLDTVLALRSKLEGPQLGVPLLVRCGRPEEHVPRLAVELGAVDVFLTTQYAPHERRVHDYTMERIRMGIWVSRRVIGSSSIGIGDVAERVTGEKEVDDEEFVEVFEHRDGHPYTGTRTEAELHALYQPAVAHSVWQSTLVHLDDLQTPVSVMKEGERWYHDDVTTAVIRPTAPYEAFIARLKNLPAIPSLLPSAKERLGKELPSLLRGRLPTLEDLGYGATPRLFRFEEVIATQSSHPTAGEDAAVERVQDWLDQGGMTSMLRFARMKRTNTKMYSPKLSRISPYIAMGALSPRKFYEMLRSHTHNNLRDGFVQMQYREALLRLSRRDYWHWMGLRYGDRLFFKYGPHPEETDGIEDWRHEEAIVQKWCMGLTGIPFADAAMRELLATGFVAHEGRQALVWLLTRGYGQDWRLAAEWLERCSLDFDPFVCYGNCAYFCQLMHDDFGEPVRNIHFLAHHHDQTGIYVKKWLPQLSKIPPVYIHRPHVLTPRMQAMHGVYIGKNYPYPLKLWQGAHRSLTAADLPAYFPNLRTLAGPGYAEAVRHGMALMQPEEWSYAFDFASIKEQAWVRGSLMAFAFDDDDATGQSVVAQELPVLPCKPKLTSSTAKKTLLAADSSGH